MADPAAAPAGDQSVLDDLLEDSWTNRSRTVRGRELRLELAMTAGFVLATVALIVLAPPDRFPPPAAFAVTLAFALAARVEFPVGAVIFVPTHLFLIPLFVLAPAQLVPALVFLGLLLGALGAAATGRQAYDRTVFCGGDAVHALGAAIVLVVLAEGDATQATLAVLLLAFAAQLVADLASSSVHELLITGVKASVHARTVGMVWAVDVALSSIGALAGWAATSEPWAALGPLPFLGLLAALARDRTRRVEAAHDRLRALERERKRLRAAAGRVGEAFASNLDLDSLLRIVTGSAVEALDGEAARAARLVHGELAEHVSRQGDAAAGAALKAAERDLLATGAMTGGAALDDLFAVAGLIGTPREPLGVVSVARPLAFSPDERDMLGYLCEQATISAANATSHELLRVAEAQMRHQAFHDPLTGLTNRTLFADRVDHALKRHSRGDERAGVLFIDLDGFKQINDTLGHEMGDEMLKAIAQRITGCLRLGDTAARFGGDEFAVIYEGLESPSAAQAMAERLLRTVTAPLKLREHDLRVGASIGIALDGPGLARDDILRRADLAMYAAKHAGGRRCTAFDPAMLDQADSRLELTHDLRGAVERGELLLRFQPLHDLSTGAVGLGEALVRWRHPERGLLLPEAFIGLAEDSGIIDELGRFVLDEACRAACTWGPTEPTVAVNVSASQLRARGFAGFVARTLRRHGLPASRLMLEVTESVLVESDAATLDNLTALRRSGVSLALDDFGTGYSSLSYLARLPVDVLKLDRSFLSTVDESPVQARLLAGVTALAHSLGLRLVAEGIERASQLEHLQELGVDLGQGFLLGRPTDAQAFTDQLAAPHSPARRIIAPHLRLVH